MSHIDKKILFEREEKKKRKYSSIEDGYYINGEIIEFVPKKVLDRFFISLPIDFKLMPDELAKVKYPIEFRPQRIYTIVNLTVNFCFSSFSDEMIMGDLKIVAERVMATIYKETKGCQLLETGEIEKIDGHWFSFQSSAMDDNLYNMMLFSEIGGSVIHSTFNCPYREKELWKQIVIPMWESIKTIDEVEDKK